MVETKVLGYLVQYAGREERLLEVLTARFGPEPPTAGGPKSQVVARERRPRVRRRHFLKVKTPNVLTLVSVRTGLPSIRPTSKFPRGLRSGRVGSI